MSFMRVLKRQGGDKNKNITAAKDFIKDVKIFLRIVLVNDTKEEGIWV